jgi:hypothetical protein
VKALSHSTEMVIRRAPEDVFDFCSDLRSELQWNPKVKSVEKLTDGLISGHPPPTTSTQAAAPVCRSCHNG